MSGNAVQICFDVLHSINAVEYGILRYKTLQSDNMGQSRPSNQKKVDAGVAEEDLSDLTMQLEAVKVIFENILGDILQDDFVSAQDDNKLQQAEERMQHALNANFSLFIGAARLMGKQVGKICTALRLDARILIALLPLLWPGRTTNYEENLSKEIVKFRIIFSSERRFQSVLEAELESLTSLDDLKQRWKNASQKMKEDTFWKLGKDLESLNDRIKAIWERCSPRRIPRTHDGLSKILEIQQDASALATVLSHQNGFSCSCYDYHLGYLEVPNVLASSSQPPENRSCLAFRVVFENKQRKKVLQYRRPKWEWATLSATVLQIGQGAAGIKKRKVGFGFKNWKPNNSEVKSPLDFDLCKSIGAWQDSSEISKATGKFECDIGDAQLGIIKLKFEDSRLSIDKTMVGFWKGCNPCVLSVSQKLQLGIKAAESILYLHETTLLRKLWTSDDIWLSKSSNEQSSPSRLFLQATANREMNRDTADANGSVEENGSTKKFLTEVEQVMDPRLISLGVFLVELAINRPWPLIRTEYLPDGSFGSPGFSAYDLLAIYKVLEDSRDQGIPSDKRPLSREGPIFQEVIRKCVTGDFGKINSSEMPLPSLEDSSFRRMVYDQVICGLRDAVEDYGFAEKWTSPMDLMDGRLFDDEILIENNDVSCVRAIKWFEMIRKQVQGFFKESKPCIGDERRVKIAVLDTGLDGLHDFIKTELKRIKFKSFLTGNEAMEDLHGHGTHIAGLILRLAKNADLYVYRVAVKDEFTEENIEAIAQALHDAVTQQVDIVSISLGFNYRTKALVKVHEALMRAYSKKIVIFAAASNSGANVSKLAYPADQEEVIWIGSANGIGEKSPFTPSPDISDTFYKFTALGEGVSSSWPTSLPGEAYQAKSGTSYATPIAAAIAAAVMDFMRFKFIGAAPDSEDDDILHRMRSKKAMQQILLRMSVKSDNFHYLAPWTLFDKYSEKRSNEIAGILRSILEKV